MMGREQTAPSSLARPAIKLSLWRRLADLVMFVRLPSCLAGASSLILGIHLTGWEGVSAQATCLGMLSMFFAVAAANAVNDVLDIDTDAIGKPNRPLPSGRLTERTGLLISGIAALAALVSARP